MHIHIFSIFNLLAKLLYLKQGLHYKEFMFLKYILLKFSEYFELISFILLNTIHIYINTFYNYKSNIIHKCHMLLVWCINGE